MSTRLDAASRIGRVIADDALWHEGRCTWVGARLEADDQGRPVRVHPVLGAGIYDGSAGVGFVLAELWGATGEAWARATAAGALRHALERPHGDPAYGLYEGRLGVAFAAIRGGRRIGEPEVEEGGRILLDRIVRAAPPRAGDGTPDLVAGRAGSVLGLLALDEEHERCRDRALDIAHDLIAEAEAGEGFLKWAHASGGGPLTGLAHGAAGVALALAEAAAATGDESLREGAAGALAFERGLFDREARNWPDLRDDTPGGGEHGGGSVAWCHGAAGIALSRLRVGDALGDEIAQAELTAAIATTAAWVRAAAGDPRAGFSLCHGVAGNADVLLECASAMAGAGQGLREIAWAAADAGIDEHDRGGRPAWPCGAAGQTPALMTGLAGIGLFLLRAERPEVRSALLMGPTLEPARVRAELRP